MATDRMMLKITQIARMRIQGVKDVQIAAALGLSNSGFQRIIRTSFYKDHEQAVLNGHISKLDEKLAANRDLLRSFAKNSVPVALQGLVEIARQRRDLKTALEAQRDILRIDPDRNFSIDGVKPSASLGGASLPQVLFDSISKDANSVSRSVASKLAAAAQGKTDS